LNYKSMVGVWVIPAIPICHHIDIAAHYSLATFAELTTVLETVTHIQESGRSRITADSGT